MLMVEPSNVHLGQSKGTPPSTNTSWRAKVGSADGEREVHKSDLFPEMA